jgi:hypothetical protein
MDYVGDHLKVDIEWAWEAAVKSFPAMAKAYQQANVATHHTCDVDGLEVEFLTNWRSLRDQVEYIFGDAATNLHLTAECICESLKAFADADSAAASALSSAVSEFGDSVPEVGHNTDER